MRYGYTLAVGLAAAVAATGCATRGSVRQVDAKVQQQARQIDAAAARLDGAEQRADRLGQRVDGLDVRVGQLARHHHSAQVVETIEVPFGFNRADLGDRALTRLNELARELKQDGRLAVELLGFTDTRGPLAYNVQLSQRRVEAVRRYLVQQGAPVSRVAAVGLGPATERDVPEPRKRRVIVHVTMSEPMVMAEPSASAATTPPAVQGETRTGGN